MQKKHGPLAWTLIAWLLSGAAAQATSHGGYPEFDVGSTSPPEVTRDIEAVIGEFAARMSSREWYTVLELWDPDEETPYYLLSHQPDWLIGWDQLRGYFARKQTFPEKPVPELNPTGIQQIEKKHYTIRAESELQAMRYTPSDIRVRQIGDDLAIAVWYVKFDYKPYFMPPLGETFKANAVFRNTAAGWQFIHYAETPDSAIMYFERLYRQQASPDFVEMTKRKKKTTNAGGPPE
ncbi:MAG: hypothetical protein QNJ73_08865 [Gammaproteobacteria bacterium]|nr:hypothetical protein [Gammaproteobacteria bacterium]